MGDGLGKADEPPTVMPAFAGIHDLDVGLDDPRKSWIPGSAGHDGQAVVAAARGWVGTPYRHQASVKGAGADCLGVVRGVWRELVGPEPEALPPYARSWAEDGRETLMLDAARRWLVAAPDGAIAAGDVLLFRVARGKTPRHCGIATGAKTMVHAYDGHAVAETPIPEVWERRLVGRFWFPILEAGP